MFVFRKTHLLKISLANELFECRRLDVQVTSIAAVRQVQCRIPSYKGTAVEGKQIMT